MLPSEAHAVITRAHAILSTKRYKGRKRCGREKCIAEIKMIGTKILMRTMLGSHTGSIDPTKIISHLTDPGVDQVFEEASLIFAGKSLKKTG